MALLKLQVTFGDAARSLADLNAALTTATEAEDDAEDPRRLALVKRLPAASLRKPAAPHSG
jgi:hypothetical protein